MTIKVNGEFLGTAKKYEEFIIVDTFNYTKVLLPEEFEAWVKERGFTVE